MQKDNIERQEQAKNIRERGNQMIKDLDSYKKQIQQSLLNIDKLSQEVDSCFSLVSNDQCQNLQISLSSFKLKPSKTAISMEFSLLSDLKGMDGVMLINLRSEETDEIKAKGLWITPNIYDEERQLNIEFTKNIGYRMSQKYNANLYVLSDKNVSDNERLYAQFIPVVVWKINLN